MRRFVLAAAFDWAMISALGSMLAAIVAAVYTYYTYHLLQNNRLAVDRSNRLYEFQFYKEITERLNTPDARRLTDLCQNNLLQIDYAIGAKDTDGNKVSSNFLNRTLLNELESIAVFWKNGLINLIPVNTGFGYKILTIGNCPVIADHILRSRVAYPNTFAEFEELYRAIYTISTPEERRSFKPAIL